MTPEHKEHLERVLKRLDEPVYAAISAKKLIQLMIDELQKEEAPPNNCKPKRATCLTEDWVLPEAWAVWAKENGCPNPLKEADIFRDWWIAKSGKDASKKNWQATWRNWIRRGYDAPEPASCVAAADWESWTIDDWKGKLGRSDCPHFGPGSWRFNDLNELWHTKMPGLNPWKKRNTCIPEEIYKQYADKWGWVK